MISHHVIASAGDAERYYIEMKGDGRAEYYKGDRPNESWGGKGLSYAGIEDHAEVSKEDFRAVLEGRMFNAITGETQQLDNGKGEHTPAIDLTVSAPKSVSMMAFIGQDTRLQEALGRCADRAMEAIEANITVRRREGGEMHHVTPGNIVYARFEHETSRENDPNWHRHYVIANASFDRETGKWRSLEMGSAMKLKRMGDAIFKNELAKELKALGYEVDWTKDGPEIRGITRGQIEKFSQRSAQVVDNLAQNGLTRDTASGGQKNVAALDGRSAKVQLPRTELQTEWEKRAANIGVKIEEIKAAAISREVGRKVESYNAFSEARKAVEHAVSHLADREQMFTKAAVVQFANEFAKGKASASHIEHAIVELEKHGQLIARDGEANKSGALNDRFTTQKAIDLEKESVSLMLQGKGVMPVIAAPVSVRERLAAFEDRKSDELGKPFKLNEGQREAVMQILASRDQFTALQGFAGTGKTTIMEAVREIAEAQGVQVIGLSAGAKQAAILQRDSGIQSDTVAMFLTMREKAQQQESAKLAEKTAAGDLPGRSRWEKSEQDSAAVGVAKSLSNHSGGQREERQGGVHSREIDVWGVLPKGKYLFTKEGTFRANTGLGAFRNNLAFEAQAAMRQKRWDAERNGQVMKALGMRILERSAASMVRWEKQDIATAVLARAVDKLASFAADKALHDRVQRIFSKSTDLLSDQFRAVSNKVAEQIQERYERSKQAVDKGNLSWASPNAVNGGGQAIGAIAQSARVGITAPGGNKIFVPRENMSWSSPSSLNGAGKQWDPVEAKFSGRLEKAVAQLEAIPSQHESFDKRVSGLQSAIEAAESHLAKSYKVNSEGVWTGKKVGEAVEGRLVEISHKELSKPDGSKYTTPTATVETHSGQKVTVVGVDLPRALGRMEGSDLKRFEIGDVVRLRFDGNRTVQVPDLDKDGVVTLVDVKRNSFSVADVGHQTAARKSHLAEAKNLLAEIQGARIENVTRQSAEGVVQPRLGQMREAPTKLLIVDEASMLSQADMNRLQRVAAKEGIRVVWSGDKAQHGSVEAGKAFENQLNAGIAKTVLTEVTRLSETNVKGREAYKSLVPDISFMGEKKLRVIGREGDAVAAFKALRGVEIDGDHIKTKSDLIDRLAKTYADSGASKSLIVTATNADRIEINNAVREELVARGQLGKTEASIISMEGKKLTSTEKKFVSSYEVGQILETTRAYKSLGLANKERVEITGIDHDKNVLHIRTKDGRDMVINPERHSGLESYSQQRILLAEGDQIRITKNDKAAGISNGDVGKVTKIEGSQITFRIGEGAHSKEHTIDANKEHHVGYLYATTTVGAQGDTKLKTMYYINTERSGGVGERSFYVGITRAKEDTIIFADNLAKASGLVERSQDKSGALSEKELAHHVREELGIGDNRADHHDFGVGR